MSDKKIIDAMWDDSPIDVSTEVNFIWSIANKLRGPYRSDKYKDVIIPMTIMVTGLPAPENSCPYTWGADASHSPAGPAGMSATRPHD